MKKVVVFCISGIGNAILFTPALKLLKGKYSVTIVASTSAIGQVFDKSLYENLIVFNKSPISNILKLRSENFDYSICAFPSNRWEFNVLAFLVGAKERITHHYNVGFTLSFLQNKKIKANPELHDVEQNMELLSFLGIKEKTPEISFASDKSTDFFKKHKLNPKKVIAIHPGTKSKDSVRRWSADKFAQVCNMLKAKKYEPLILQGPDDNQAVEELVASLEFAPIIAKDISLKEMGAIISKCRAFIGTDSGLGHIAVAEKVKSLVIFGPANPKRTTPRPPFGKWIRAGCPDSPGLKYPFWSTTDKISCPNNFECLGKLSAKKVFDELVKHAKL